MEYYNKYIKYKTKYIHSKKFTQNGGANNTQILLFKADWCGHCQKFLPIWNNIQKNNPHILFNTYDNQNPLHKQFFSKYNVKGFPTIIKLKNNKPIEFNESRTLQNLQTFIDN